MHILLAPLNEQQRAAVEAIDGPVLILAGAGSGKTKTLIHRIAYIIAQGKAKPWNILAVTFTNKAAGEMKERLRKLLGVKTADKKSPTLPIMGTFHSICVQILRRDIAALGYNSNFVIYDSGDSANLIKKSMKDLGIDTKAISPNGVQSVISRAKNELLTPELFAGEADSPLEKNAAQVYDYYQQELHRNNALDFDDLIRLTVKLWQEHPEVLKKYQQAFQYIMVDEYQDTNHAQYLLVELLSKEHHNLCVVGDDWQSIYSWRGANLQNILDFEEDHPDAKVILLEQNYRSTQSILDAANEVIKYNTKQKDKTLWTENPRGEKLVVQVVANEQAEGEYIIQEIFGESSRGNSRVAPTNNDDAEIKYVDEDAQAVEESILDRVMRSNTFQSFQKDQHLVTRIRQLLGHTDLSQYVVLYRTNAQSRALEEAFLKYNIPYRIIGGIKFYERREIKDLIAYVKALVNPLDWVSLERISNVPARSLGAQSWLKIEAACREHNVTFLEVSPTQLPTLRAAQLAAFQGFQKTMQSLTKKITDVSPSQALELIIKYTDFRDQFDARTSQDQSRLENIEELKSVTKRYDRTIGVEGLHKFLEEVTLISDQDDIDESTKAVNLMTVHAAKGLEFPNVFITGLEEGLFPHARSLFQPIEMEEERRLCYVAITRAKHRVYMVYALQRTVYGSTQINAPSRFINDIPDGLLDRREADGVS